MLRSGRFKHQLYSPDQLSLHGRSYFEIWQKIKAVLAPWDLVPAEIAAIYFFTFCALRRPDDFLGGKHSEALQLRQQGQVSWAQIQNLFPPLTGLRKISPQQNILELVTTHHFRSVPHAVLRALSLWHQGRYPLVLMNRIPTALEVLELQAQHRRVVSLLEELPHFCNMVETDRDMLGFLVHDLIHAEHFFHNEENARLQSFFSQFLLRMMQRPQVQTSLLNDSVFEKEFLYLAADMNSVPLHLFKTLKAVTLGHFKRTHGILPNAPLPEDLEQKWHKEISSLLFDLDWPEESINSFSRLNSPSFSISEDYLPLIKQLC